MKNLYELNRCLIVLFCVSSLAIPMRLKAGYLDSWQRVSSATLVVAGLAGLVYYVAKNLQLRTCSVADLSQFTESAKNLDPSRKDWTQELYNVIVASSNFDIKISHAEVAIKNGANVNFITSDGKTILALAANLLPLSGDTDDQCLSLVKLLVDNGALITPIAMQNAERIALVYHHDKVYKYFIDCAGLSNMSLEVSVVGGPLRSVQSAISFENQLLRLASVPKPKKPGWFDAWFNFDIKAI